MEFENMDIEAESIAKNTELIVGANSKISRPVVGMTFNDEEELWDFYKNHEEEEGFGITTRSSHVAADGKVESLTLTCCRSGKYQKSSKKSPTSSAIKENGM